MSLNTSKEERKAAVNRARVASIQAKYEETQRAKEQIANALKSVNKPGKNRIVFDSDEEISTATNPHPQKEKIQKNEKKTLKGDALFGLNESENEEEIDFKVKKQFEGKRGQELMEAQAKIGGDSRFQLDTRFLEELDSDSYDDKRSQLDNIDNSEVKKNLSILNDVMGVKSVSLLSQKRTLKFSDPSKTRYDPTKTTSKNLEKIVNSKKPQTETEKIIEQPKLMPGKFFQTSYSTLKKSFAKKDDQAESTHQEVKSQPFSFSSMFNNDENIQLETNKVSDSDYKTLPPDKYNLNEDVGKYSSSETEEEGDDMEVESNNFEDKKSENTFFINSCSDHRIVTGVKDFLCKKSDDEISRDWLAVRDILINEYKKKHKDAKRRWHDK